MQQHLHSKMPSLKHLQANSTFWDLVRLVYITLIPGKLLIDSTVSYSSLRLEYPLQRHKLSERTLGDAYYPALIFGPYSNITQGNFASEAVFVYPQDIFNTASWSKRIPLQVSRICHIIGEVNHQTFLEAPSEINKFCLTVGVSSSTYKTLVPLDCETLMSLQIQYKQGTHLLAIKKIHSAQCKVVIILRNLQEILGFQWLQTWSPLPKQQGQVV